MKLYSDYRDYYDPILHDGDDHIKWERKEGSPKIVNPMKFAFGRRYRARKDKLGIFDVTPLSFCGRLFLPVHFYSFGTCKTQIKYGDELREFIDDKKSYFYGITHLIKHILENDNSIKLPNLVELHRKMESPILLFSEEWVSANPCLLKLDFPRIIDPYQCAQEISMFMGNDMAKEKEIPELSDKSRKDKHGFDEWSFRNPLPPKRKR